MPDDHSLPERVAYLEAKAEKLDMLCERLDDLASQMHALNATLSSHRTFVGGIVFTVSAVWAAFTFAAEYLRGP